MYVDVRMIPELLHQLLGLLQRLLKRVWVRPREVGGVVLIKVVEAVAEANYKSFVFCLIPAQITLLSLPLHGVR